MNARGLIIGDAEDSAKRGEHIRRLRGEIMRLVEINRVRPLRTEDLHAIVKWSIDELPELADRP